MAFIKLKTTDGSRKGAVVSNDVAVLLQNIKQGNVEAPTAALQAKADKVDVIYFGKAPAASKAVNVHLQRVNEVFQPKLPYKDAE